MDPAFVETCHDRRNPMIRLRERLCGVKHHTGWLVDYATKDRKLAMIVVLVGSSDTPRRIVLRVGSSTAVRTTVALRSQVSDKCLARPVDRPNLRA